MPPVNAIDKIVQIGDEAGVYRPLTLIGKDDREPAGSAGRRPARLTLSNSLSLVAGVGAATENRYGLESRTEAA
jgi:hypothetical protein